MDSPRANITFDDSVDENQLLLTQIAGVDGESSQHYPTGKPFTKTATFWVLCYVCMMLNTGYAIVAPTLHSYFTLERHEGGLAAPQKRYGLVSALFSIGHFVGSVILGRLSDKFHPKILMSVALTIGLCGAIAYALAPSEAVLYPARFFWGFAGGLFPICGAAAARATNSEQERTRAMGVLVLAGATGYITGPALSAATSHANAYLHLSHPHRCDSTHHTPTGPAPPTPPPTGTFQPCMDDRSIIAFDKYRAPGWCAAGCIILGFLLMLFVAKLKKPPSKAQAAAANLQQGPAGPKALKGRAFILVCLIMHWLTQFMVFFDIAAREAEVAPIAIDAWNWHPQTISILWLAWAGLMVVTMGITSWVLAGKVLDSTTAFVCACGAFAAELCMINFPHLNATHVDSIIAVSRVRFFILSVVSGGFIAPTLGANNAGLSKVTPPTAMGFAIGVMAAFGALSRAVAPIIANAIYITWGANMVWFLVAGVCLCNVVLTGASRLMDPTCIEYLKEERKLGR